jgi:hypothetical protein
MAQKGENTIKRPHLGLLFLFLLLSACGSSGPSKEIKAQLIGTWYDAGNSTTMEFKDETRGSTDFTEFTYEWLSETEIEIKYGYMTSPMVVNYEIELEGDTLVLTYRQEGFTLPQTYERVE